LRAHRRHHAWLKVAHLAEAFNVAVCPHFLMELHVSLTAAVPNGAWVEYIPQLDTITSSRITLKDGHAVPPDAPALGWSGDFARIDKAAVARATVDGLTQETEHAHPILPHHPASPERRRRDRRGPQLVGGTKLLD
jgi:hypothetical protein